jgi:hypothetical protein
LVGLNNQLVFFLFLGGGGGGGAGLMLHELRVSSTISVKISRDCLVFTLPGLVSPLPPTTSSGGILYDTLHCCRSTLPILEIFFLALHAATASIGDFQPNIRDLN